MIQLDGAATLFKSDATTTELDVDVLIDSAEIHVDRRQAERALPGRRLALGRIRRDARPRRVGPPDHTAGDRPSPAVRSRSSRMRISHSPCRARPALHRLGIGAGATLDVSIDDGTTGAVAASPPPVALGDEIAVAAGATLGIAGGGGTLALADHDASERLRHARRHACEHRRDGRAEGCADDHRRLRAGRGRQRSRSTSAAPATATSCASAERQPWRGRSR